MIIEHLRSIIQRAFHSGKCCDITIFFLSSGDIGCETSAWHDLFQAADIAKALLLGRI